MANPLLLFSYFQVACIYLAKRLCARSRQRIPQRSSLALKIRAGFILVFLLTIRANVSMKNVFSAEAILLVVDIFQRYETRLTENVIPL